MAFLDTSLVAMRESLEALLILGILLGIATKLGQPEARRPLLLGALAGVGASILAGLLAARAAHELYESNEKTFEGIAAFVAVVILTYMIVWMYRHTQGMIGALTHKTRDALGKSSVLFGVSFVAVFREGIETVLFTASRFQTDGFAVTTMGLLIGIAVATFVAFLIFAGFLRLSIERFMLGTGLLLVVIAAGLLGYGAHELTEAGVLPETGHPYDLGGILPKEGILGSLLFGLFVYRQSPTWLEIGLWWAYVLTMGTWVVLKLLKHRKAAQLAGQPPQAAQPTPPASPSPPVPSAPPPTQAPPPR